MKTILKVLVGSRAHGLADETSDYDYRGVFVLPTSAILSLEIGQQKPTTTTWIEGGTEDVTAWEIGHYLRLAMNCNPSILEVLAAPVVEADETGRELQALFPYMWSPRQVRDAFVGYGLNQRKKFLDDKDKRSSKYAVAYLRTLYQATMLLGSGELPVAMQGTVVYNTLKAWRSGEFTSGSVIDTCLRWQECVEKAAAICAHKPEPEKLNEFLLRVRRKNWS